MTNARSLDLLGPCLPAPREIAAWDAAAINEFGIPETLLMENAAREAFHVIHGMLRAKSRVLVIMGGGNNGGDGACLARHLHDAGHDILVLHVKPVQALTGAAREHADIAVKTGVRFLPLELGGTGFHGLFDLSGAPFKPDMVVDALLGTGFAGSLRDREREIVERINEFHGQCPIVSLDVPSGLNALSGHPAPEAVRADATVTFEAAKTGLAYPHAATYTGKLAVRAIGIPKAVRAAHPASFRLLAPTAEAWPEVSPSMHKGNAGRVVIFGGSHGLTGAPALAALGALRNGAGLVTIACPSSIEPHVRNGVPEIMTIPIGQAASWSLGLIPDCLKILHELPHAAALVVGPGIGRDAQTLKLVATLVAEKQRPSLVLDADGLAALDAVTLAALREDDCITPHPGEAAHILQTSTEDVQAARVEALRELMRVTRATVVLKGAGTLIGQADFPIFIAPFATPSLAIGGSGDVLSGIIAAFIAHIRASRAYTFHVYDAFRAAALGVFLHGEAGRLLNEAYPHRGALAREIADMLPRVAR
ncbi:MAG: Bifunctional NAD(P)H-hydrate repair enzyme Nnr [Desulfovibrio sp.]